MSNKMALDALTAAKQPLELYHAYGWPDRHGVRAQVDAAIAALQAEPQPLRLVAKDGDVLLQFKGGSVSLCAVADQRGPIVREQMMAALEEFAALPATPPKD